jgi:hypothetical protein
MRRVLRLVPVALFALIPIVGVFAEGELSRDAEKLYSTALRTAKASRIKEQQERLLARAYEEVETGELAAVIARFRKVEDPPRSHAEVLDLLVREYLHRRFGDQPAKEIENLNARFADPAPEVREALLVDSLGLTDYRLATYLVMKAAAAEEPALRRRAALCLGDLVNYGVDDGALSGRLLALLSDPDAGVRATAVRRGFEVGLDIIYDWALDNLGDDEKAAVTLRGREEVLIPGEEALRGLQELTFIQRDLPYRKFLAMSDQARVTFLELFRAWWANRGRAFPSPGFREAEFKRRPSATKTLVLKADETSGSFSLWAGLDRTKIRVAVDEFTMRALTPLDFEVNGHVRYMAQGMRPDDGEGFIRNLPVGKRHILARKAIGCYVLVFQRLTGNRVAIHLMFHDPDSL